MAPQLSCVATGGELGPPTRLVYDRYRQADVEWQRHCEKGQHVQGRAAIDPLLCPVEQRDRYSCKLVEEQTHSQERTGPGKCAQPSLFPLAIVVRCNFAWTSEVETQRTLPLI